MSASTAPRTRALGAARAAAATTADQVERAAFVERIRAQADAFAAEPVEMSDVLVGRLALLLAA